MTEEQAKALLDKVIDEFVIPLANMHVDVSNTVNVVELCRKAAELMAEKA